jgi:type II secretory pathway pseudopilin PulG
LRCSTRVDIIFISIMNKSKKGSKGFTVVELMVSTVLLLILAGSFLALFSALIGSATVAKRKSISQNLATNQMEYLKSLPYDSLAVAGGSIAAATPLPATTTQTINNIVYTIKTSINYVDEAYDGCGSYPDLPTKQKYCRNYPPPAGAPATDTNPADYKILHVTVTIPTAIKLAEVDTQVSARVAETASTTGALFVQVIDDGGNPVSGATVQATNSTLTPAVNVSDSTDANGIAIFYGLPPDTGGFNYNINGSKNGYSSLSTIAPAGALVPTYSNQKIFTQLSSSVTLVLRPQAANSLVIEATDTAGAPLASAKIYVKGGYKKYTDTADTSYYFDNMSPDTRPTTDVGGLASLSNLVPGQYIFCGDSGVTSCTVGATTYYLAAAVPYSGNNPFNPINVPTSATTPSFAYGGLSYLQKVRLMLTTNVNFPRVFTLNPNSVSLATSNLTAFAFVITGANLPCDPVAANCTTTVRFTQGVSTYTASCTGATAGTQLDCTVNLTGITAGDTQLVVVSGGNTLTVPGSPMLGGLNVTP